MLAEFIYPHDDRWLTGSCRESAAESVTESVRVSRWDRVLVEISTQTAFPSSIGIQNSHRHVGLQAGMPMKTAGLVVHLHVHVDFFLQIVTNHARLFSHRSFRGVKNVPIFAHFFQGTAHLVKWAICLKIPPRTIHIRTWNGVMWKLQQYNEETDFIQHFLGTFFSRHAVYILLLIYC